MKLPYVIDNQTHKLADVLNQVMREHPGMSLDIATAYFSVSGYRTLRESLYSLRSFRLLLGFQPAESADVGLRPNASALQRALRGDLNAEPYTEETLRLVEDLIAYLRKEESQVRLFEDGFLHAKAYLLYGDKDGFDRFLPLAGIVGSSNFTGPGLLTNRELNLAHKTLLNPEEVDDASARAAAERLLEARLTASIAESNRRLLKSEVGARAILDLVDWFETQWNQSRDFKTDLIELLDTSKFGGFEYTPYDIYLKAIYTYFKDDLDATDLPQVRSAVELSEFQEDAVKKARRILAKYDGVLIGDSVGMGKTWIGKKLLEDYAYHQRMKALVVCPAALREMWERELASATIAAQVVTQESLGQVDGRLDLSQYADVDVILVDESHNFRSRGSQRYENLSSIIAANRGRGRSGMRTKVILLTATPINNNIFDLYNQITLFTQNDRGYFAGAGIGDLYRYFLSARQQARDEQSTAALFNLLEEVVIRRTRPFIRKAYPNATINGKPVRWPERKLRTVNYDLEAAYQGIYEQIVGGIERLTLATYSLESFKKSGVERDEFEEGREAALVGIFKTRYLKRLESSVDAFRISIRRALAFTKTFEEYVLGGRLLDSRSFQKAMQFLAREDEEDDALPASLAEEFDANEDARAFLESLPALDPAQYDLRKLHRALQKDVEIFTEIWARIKDILPEKDAKLQRLKSLLENELRGKKVLIFTYYKDTARYLYRELGMEKAAAWREGIGNPHIRRMDSGASPKDRSRLIQAFSPRSNNKPEIAGTNEEVDVMISTDVLSEGQNLQDCGILVNYDLHWNPTRMVQRAGRIDRIGSEFETILIHNLFPDAGLERLLGLVESLSQKIAQIDATGFLDASVLGETVHPRNFNTLRRIRDEDGSVVQEQEEVIELASSEFMLQQLKSLLASGARERLENLPDGIHSGLHRAGYRGLFFYFTAPDPSTPDARQHFWRYYDLATRKITDNRFTIANLIACSPDTPRLLGEADVFAIQEKVRQSILESIQTQVAMEAAPKITHPIQQTVSAVLREHLNNPKLQRGQVRQALRVLSQPMIDAAIRKVKSAYEAYQVNRDESALLSSILALGAVEEVEAAPPPKQIRAEDLHLVCWEYVWS
ncbi:MAG: helicase-related protein [Chloroflexota bacterium]